MNNTMSFIKYLLIGMIAVFLLGQSLVCASDDSVQSLIVKGTLSHKDGKPVENKNIYFFAVYYTDDGKQLSAQTSIQNGRMANPFAATDDNGLFNINITSDFLKKTDSKLFSIGIIRGFGPGFTIVRSQKGVAVTIDIDPNKVAAAKSTRTIDIGKIILD